MKTSEELKQTTRDKYGEIALISSEPKAQDHSCGCGSGCGCNDEEMYNIMSSEYQGLEGYVPDADLGLGCGVPTEFANIKAGHNVLDLGSGAGNDAFVTSKIVGDTGKVVGIDFTTEMIEKANEYKTRFSINNVEFVFGDIEDMPLENDTFDRVISNCVLNLVPDKQKAFSEIHRVLKTDGSFCVSDIVLEGELPEKMKKIADFYTGCISGASQMSNYLKVITDAGFRNVIIHKKKEIEVADDILMYYLSKDEIESFVKSEVGIFSITVSAKK